MDSKVYDWKALVALGGTAVVSIFVLKMDANSATATFNHLVDAAKESVIAIFGKR